MNAPIFEVLDYGPHAGLVEARAFADAGDGELLADAHKLGGVWHCYRRTGQRDVTTVATKPEAKERIREYAEAALRAGASS